MMSLDVSKVLKSSMENEFADCEALVLDLRGRGGILPAVLNLNKTIGSIEIPVVAITDELTRSAKELLSHQIKKHENVTVIGERTSGAVTAATFTRLPSGNALMFPVMPSSALSRYTDKVILEGVGVEPDEAVNFEEPFCDGNDKLLEFAIRRAAELSSAVSK